MIMAERRNFVCTPTATSGLRETLREWTHLHQALAQIRRYGEVSAARFSRSITVAPAEGGPVSLASPAASASCPGRLNLSVGRIHIHRGTAPCASRTG